MFYALDGRDSRAMRELNVAFADGLTGPWTRHPRNPVRTGLGSSRPGGSPFLHQGELYFPTQDCTTGYGTGINLLRIDRLTPDAFAADSAKRLSPEGWLAGFDQGLHTLSDAGNVTLIDVKRLERSPMRHLIKLERWLRKQFA